MMLSCTQHVNHVIYLVAINKLYEAVAYLGFYFGGGGGSKYFWKSGGICMVRSHAFSRGVRGNVPPRKFLKMV